MTSSRNFDDIAVLKVLLLLFSGVSEVILCSITGLTRVGALAMRAAFSDADLLLQGQFLLVDKNDDRCIATYFKASIRTA